MASFSANKNIMVITDEVTSFTQYSGESLIEAWYRMQENVGNSPNMHTQGSIIKSFYNGVSAWGRIFLDGLTNGHFATGDPSLANILWQACLEIMVRLKRILSFNNLKENYKK
jgi:hypothetical protein